jgi:hypothetical protein
MGLAQPKQLRVVVAQHGQLSRLLPLLVSSAGKRKTSVMSKQNRTTENTK